MILALLAATVVLSAASPPDAVALARGVQAFYEKTKDL